MQVVAYSMNPGRGITTERGTVLLIPVTPRIDSAGSPTLTLAEILLAGPQAQRIPVLPGEVTVSATGKEVGLPASFALNAAHPNPFNPSTTIAYEVPQQAHITLVVYNLLGHEVMRLVDRVQAPGRYRAVWNGRNSHDAGVASGVYVYRLTSSTGYSDAKRVVLVK
jgi:hypothetical protein